MFLTLFHTERSKPTRIKRDQPSRSRVVRVRTASSSDRHKKFHFDTTRKDYQHFYCIVLKTYYSN